MLPETTKRFYRSQQELKSKALAAVRREWARMGEDFDLSWMTVSPRVNAIVVEAKRLSAVNAVEYAVAEGIEIGMPVELPAPVNVAAFEASIAGVSVAEVTRRSVVTSKSAVASGLTSVDALRRGGAWLSRLTVNEITASSSDALAATIAVSPTTTGFVRMLNPPSCKDCLILAGKWFRWNEGFDRHPNCFPAGVVVSGPSPEGATRRWFEGELVTLTTASGQELPATGNHPILTSRGWVPANLIKEGDYVVCSTQPEGATPLVVPDHNQVPALIEDVWGSLSVHGLDRVPTTAEDFHGDGQDGEVDVVYADSTLLNRREPSLFEHGGERGLTGGIALPSGFDMQGIAQFGDLRDSSHSGGSVRGGNLALSLAGGQLLIPGNTGFAEAPSLDASAIQALGDGASGYSVLDGEGVFARPGEVGVNDFPNGERVLGSRWCGGR